MARTYQPTAEDEDDSYPWPVPWHARLLSWAIVGGLSVIWILHLLSGERFPWGLSGERIAQGRFDTIVLHMFEHGGAAHLVMNSAALLAISPPLLARLGTPPSAWLGYCVLFLGSGLAGAALYLALHPFGTVPMVGASGAIYGLFGLLVRLPADGDRLEPFRSPKMRAVAVDFVKVNAVLFALLAGLAYLAGAPGGLAWEAHVGGFAFGALAGPYFLPQTWRLKAPASVEIDHPEVIA